MPTKTTHSTRFCVCKKCKTHAILHLRKADIAHNSMLFGNSITIHTIHITLQTNGYLCIQIVFFCVHISLHLQEPQIHNSTPVTHIALHLQRSHYIFFTLIETTQSIHNSTLAVPSIRFTHLSLAARVTVHAPVL